ncbi:MAG: TIGR03915 family putative DNA repair protein [Bacteroidota bacterium]
MDTYVTDGSLEGLLCAVYEWFEKKPGKVLIKTNSDHQPDVFGLDVKIYNDNTKADRVWKGLQTKLSAGWLRKFYCAYLSELPEINFHLFEFACYIFGGPPDAAQNFGNEHVLKLAQTARMVEREKHRMEAFIRFRKTQDEHFYCSIDPDFNVMPLILNHFRNRYADQRWVIYDIRRHYGIYYDLEHTSEIHLDRQDEQNLKKPGAVAHDQMEDGYETLWKNYFRSANIAARKNTRLHVKHVPKRYWKYLPEKH